MRRIHYSVAASLDGYIAGPKGEFDWIPMDPDIDFAAMFARFDTILVGGRTYDQLVIQGQWSMPEMRTLVFSRTLKQADHPKVTLVSDNTAETLDALRNEPGKDIWLYGGGLLFRSLADLGLVDVVEVAVLPVLLGNGIPLLPAPADRLNLKLTSQKLYEKTGTLLLQYDVQKNA